MMHSKVFSSRTFTRVARMRDACIHLVCPLAPSMAILTAHSALHATLASTVVGCGSAGGGIRPRAQ